MKRRIFIFFTYLFLALSIACIISVVAEQQPGPNKYHGADSFFKAKGISLFWAILKGTEESNSWVYIKIINQENSLKPFYAFSLIATDPFSNSEEWIITGQKLTKENIIKLNRESFKKMMGKTFFFYQSEKIENYPSELPDMTVYYLSVPDTAPEFLDLEKLEAYFKDLEKRLEKVESTVK
ncbi:MAG TPA: hypothetical protein ENO17_08070 [Candidatus Atribacteria bacterium]|nr:hypothetical protein [Candidatus Atribacteria bacterium]